MAETEEDSSDYDSSESDSIDLQKDGHSVGTGISLLLSAQHSLLAVPVIYQASVGFKPLFQGFFKGRGLRQYSHFFACTVFYGLSWGTFRHALLMMSVDEEKGETTQSVLESIENSAHLKVICKIWSGIVGTGMQWYYVGSTLDEAFGFGWMNGFMSILSKALHLYKFYDGETEEEESAGSDEGQIHIFSNPLSTQSIATKFIEQVSDGCVSVGTVLLLSQYPNCKKTFLLCAGAQMYKAVYVEAMSYKGKEKDGFLTASHFMLAAGILSYSLYTLGK